MKKLIFLIVVIGAFALIATGCIPVVPPSEQNETSSLMKWNPPDFFVDDDSPCPGAGTEVDPYCTIQAAIDAASSGDTIEVAEGIYTETVTVNKSVTLLGANYDVDPAGGLDRGGESVIVGQVEFTSTGDGATLNGFKLNGNRVYVNGASGATVSYNIVVDSSMHGIRLESSSPNTQVLHNTISNPSYDGICNYVGNSGVIISHNHITGVIGQPPIVSGMHTGTGIEITYNVISGCTGNKGIDYWGGPGANISYNEISGIDWEAIFTDTTATIQNNIIDDCLKEGIVLYSGASNSTVSENTISNCLKGIVLYSSNSTVSENTISNTTCEGIQAYASATITGNEISGCYKGIQVRASNSTVSGNTISNTTYQGIEALASVTITDNGIIGGNDGIWLDNAADDSTVSHNQISNTVYAGINIRGGCTGATVTCNDISGCGTGIETHVGATGALVNYNNIAGNSWGVRNYDTELLNALYNWWGHATGPSHSTNTLGTGDAVSDNVDFDPWSFTPDPCEAKTLGFWKNHPDSVDAVIKKIGVPMLGDIYEVENANMALEILKNAKAKNAYDMLAAQLLTAELNLLHLDRISIDSSCFDDPIDNADEHLAFVGYNGFDSLEKPTKDEKDIVIGYMEALDWENINGCGGCVCEWD